MPLIYDELRSLASRYMRSERRTHTLQTTALVNEAYLRLVNAEVPWQDRAHFFAVAARLMRRILVDRAKAHRRLKRGGGVHKVSLETAAVLTPQPQPGLLDVDEALTRLAALDQRKADVVELVYFGGLTYREAAEALSISERTLHRELMLAKAWLYRELKGQTHDA